MSRSRRPQCSVGRGCSCCGDAGASRRARERAAQRADSRAGYDTAPSRKFIAEKESGGRFHYDAYYAGKRHR
jgi:hypothetical protein